MATSLVNTLRNGLSRNTIIPGGLWQQSIRCAARNKRGNTPGKYRGPKKNDGDYVEKGMILYRQMGLRFYPGENVGCGRDLTLFAMEPGRVVVSCEKLSPYPDSPLYPAIKAGKVVYKKFYNVVPDPQKTEFRLVSQV